MGRFTVSSADAVKIVNEVFCDNHITGAALAIHVAALEISRTFRRDETDAISDGS